jgi:hypothetical protein
VVETLVGLVPHHCARPACQHNEHHQHLPIIQTCNA